MNNDAIPIVIDNGSSYSKVGFGEWNDGDGDDTPQYLPTIVAHPDNQSWPYGSKDDVYFGSSAEARSDSHTIVNPIENGIIQNWDAMTALWEHIFTKSLKVEPHEHPVLLTESPTNPASTRETMTEIMFEQFQVPSLFIANQAALGLFSSGRTTGLALESGDGATHSVPIYEGSAIRHGVNRLDLTGKDMTNHLQTLLLERGYSLTPEILNNIKERICYVALFFEGDMRTATNGSALDKSFELPDGQILTIGNERFRTTEPLFSPSLLNKDSPGLHQIIFSSIKAADVELQKQMLQNMVLSGGNTMFNGIADRLTTEMYALAPSNITIKTVAPPERKYAAWTGGCVLASLISFPIISVSRLEYEDFGPSMMHHKFSI